jgi:hypothetical protein
MLLYRRSFDAGLSTVIKARTLLSPFLQYWIARVLREMVLFLVVDILYFVVHRL